MQENYPFLVAVKPLKAEFEQLQKIPIQSEEFVLGRSLESSVVIAYLAISRKHCVFKKINETEWNVEDCSAVGIQVNKMKLKKGSVCKLNHNDVIRLDAAGDFIYKFINNQDEDDDFELPRKRIKLEYDNDMMNNVKMKFEESQKFEMETIEQRLQNTKHMQSKSLILKSQLEKDMALRVQELESRFAAQIENLQGEKNEVERQKEILEKERDAQLEVVKVEMETKITELMDQIQKHNETETELLKENSELKKKLLKEREEFLEELNRENSSKQELLQQLEAKMREQETARATEREETEKLRLAMEKELKELEEQKKQRELELEQELLQLKSNLEAQLAKTEEQKEKAEQEMREKMHAMMRLSEEEKIKMEQLLKERAEAEQKLTEAQKNAEKSLEELQKQVSERETQLAALAADRIQKQAEQSGEVITSLQDQLEKVKSELKSLETEKNTLLESICHAEPGEGTSKQATLTEVGELMESELQCSICAELLVAATTLGCAHTYCRYCIAQWKKKKRECPICRASITSECRSLVLDSFIEKMVENLTDEMKLKRQAMLKDREELENLALQNTSGTSRGRTESVSSYGSGYDDSELGEEEEDDYENYPERYYDRYGYDRYGYDEYGDDYYDESDELDGSGSDGAPGDGGAPRSSTSVQDLAGGSSNPRERSSGNPSSRRAVRGTPGAYYGGYGRCFRCGARGHWAPGCPLRTSSRATVSNVDRTSGNTASVNTNVDRNTGSTASVNTNRDRATGDNVGSEINSNLGGNVPAEIGMNLGTVREQVPARNIDGVAGNTRARAAANNTTS